MKRRQTIKPPALLTNMMPIMKGHVRKRQKARPLRAPITSHTVPMTRREKMVPATDVMLPMYRSSLLSLRSLLMYFVCGVGGGERCGGPL